MKTNLTTKTIELTKAEMKAAMTYGTAEYTALQMIRRDYPGFEVIETVKTKKTKAAFSNLTMDDIRRYVEKHGTDEQKQSFAFLTKRSVDEDGEYHEAQSFFEIKKWFLNEFPEIRQTRKDFRQKIIQIYDAASAKATA